MARSLAGKRRAEARPRWLLRIAAVVATLFLYLAGQRTNPPGFYIDESSICWNALSIARTGHDEWGVAHPLFFRALGEYKNPVHIYLLAGVFRMIAPSNLVARRVSAIAGYLACAALGWLAFRISRRAAIAWTLFIGALLTPLLFEISRLAFEVALMPLAAALFLIAAHRAHQSERWSFATVASLVATLGLVTYVYTTGRVLGVLFTLALFILADRRQKIASACAVLAIYVAVAVTPMWLYNRNHDGALTERYKQVAVPAGTAVKQYFENLSPIAMAFSGDANSRHHVPNSGGSILAGMFMLVFASLIIIARQRRHDRWWLFVIAFALMSLLPASMTEGVHHALRLATYSVALIVLSIPALEAAPRSVVTIAIIAGTLQAAFFFNAFARDGANRNVDFDAGIREVLDAALHRGARPIYVASDIDHTSIHCLWYGAQRGVAKSAFVTVPRGTVVPGNKTEIFTLEGCSGCALIDQRGVYAAYITP